MLVLDEWKCGFVDSKPVFVDAKRYVQWYWWGLSTLDTLCIW